MGRFKPDNKVSKIRLIIWIVLLILLVGVFWFMQDKIIISESSTYKSDRVPHGFDGYKITHISDLHDTSLNYANKVTKMKPDIIVISGDISNNGKISNHTSKQISKLVDTADTYFILGDSDTDDVENQLEQLGAISLIEKDAFIGANQISLDEYVDKYFKRNKKELTDEDMEEIQQIIDLIPLQMIQLLGTSESDNENNTKDMITKNIKVDEHTFRIALVHHGEYFDTIKKSGVDLIFSGHSHGTNSFSSKYTSGVYSDYGATMFISRGLGNTKELNRSKFNFPHINTITLTDNTSNSRNLLEKTLDNLISDVGTKFDDDELTEYTYKYRRGEEK